MVILNSNNLLIVVDAGHGGWDNGASWNGRLEKDDNLRLALEVQRQLLAQGVPVLMTRDTDVFVPLADRVQMANDANASLFISLHRNSYIEQTAWTNGVINFIYLTAPETAVRAAQSVLDAVVDVGVQTNRGVQRGDYYVVRETNMPSMLLEMGYIINEIDNELFDEHLVEYAAAIARGAMEHFGLTYRYIPGVSPTPPPTAPEPECPMCPGCPIPGGRDIQALINQRFGLNMPLTGHWDHTTIEGMTMALQTALNSDFGAGLAVDGILGPKTLAAFPSVRLGQRGNVVLVIQALLWMNAVNPGDPDGIFGPRTQTSVQIFQRDNFLTPDGVVDRPTISRLLGN